MAKQQNKIHLTFNSYRYNYLYKPLWLVKSALVSDGFSIFSESNNEIIYKSRYHKIQVIHEFCIKIGAEKVVEINKISND